MSTFLGFTLEYETFKHLPLLKIVKSQVRFKTQMLAYDASRNNSATATHCCQYQSGDAAYITAKQAVGMCTLPKALLLASKIYFWWLHFTLITSLL